MAVELANTAYVRFCPVDGLHKRGLDPITITGLLLRDLRDHFREGEIENHRLNDMIWVPRHDDPNAVDVTRTGVMIEAYGYDLKEAAGSHPVIVVKRGHQDSSRSISIGGNAYHGDFLAHLPPAGGTEYTNTIKGTHIVTCGAGSAGVVELMSWEVYRQLACFATQWCRHYGFAEFKLTGIAEDGVEKLEFFDHSVAVTVEYTYTDNWVVAQVAPRLGGVAIDMRDGL